MASGLAAIWGRRLCRGQFIRLVSAERFDFRQPHFSLMLLDVPFIKKHLDQVNQHLNLAGLDVDD
ncbi:hypothetical protein [Bradyrhizobium elkanii]|uniref:hypothetical protein n=1 Tax=Bradyrhizobium elkanii TaxID=29448 RepID=UPI003513AC9E